MFPNERLQEENRGDNQGGGDPGQQALPPFDPVAFRNEFKAELLGEFRKDLNGIDKKNDKFRNELKSSFEGFTQSFKTDLASTLQTLLKPADSDDDDGDDPGQQQPPTQQAKTQEPPQQQPPHPQPQPQPKQAKKPYTPTPKEQSLQRELDEFKTKWVALETETKRQVEEAAREKLEAHLRTEIAKHAFGSKKGPDDFFELVRSRVERGDDGVVYGPQGSKLEDFVKNEYEERTYFHPPKQAGGSGAGSSYGSGNGNSFDLDKLNNPKITTDDLNSGWRAIANAMTNQK